MVSAVVKDLKGKQVADMPLASEIFAEKTDAANIATMHSAMIRQLSNARAGSANTKTRAEVRGGGAKPWRQKGTGRARAGSRRSPLWAGGGITFGPKPRDYTLAMPAKMRRSAIKSALAARVNELVIVDSFDSLKEAKTKAACQVLQDLQIAGKKLLVIVDKQKDDKFALSVRNVKNVKVVQADNIGVKELLDCEAVLTSKAMIESISKWLVPAQGDDKETSRKAPKRIKTTAKAHDSASGKIAKPTKKSVAETKTANKEEKHTKEKESPLKAIANTSAKPDKTDSSDQGAKSTKPSSKPETKSKSTGEHPSGKKGKSK